MKYNPLFKHPGLDCLNLCPFPRFDSIVYFIKPFIHSFHSRRQVVIPVGCQAFLCALGTKWQWTNKSPHPTSGSLPCPPSKDNKVFTYSNHFTAVSCAFIFPHLSYLNSISTSRQWYPSREESQFCMLPSGPSQGKGNHTVRVKKLLSSILSSSLTSLQVQASHSTSLKCSFLICKMRGWSHISRFQILLHKIFRTQWRFQSMTIKGLYSE